MERFKEILANYDFEMIYEKGETMVADFPSRHTGDNVEIAMLTRQQMKQDLDDLLSNSNHYLHKPTPKIQAQVSAAFVNAICKKHTSTYLMY